MYISKTSFVTTIQLYYLECTVYRTLVSPGHFRYTKDLTVFWEFLGKNWMNLSFKTNDSYISSSSVSRT